VHEGGWEVQRIGRRQLHVGNVKHQLKSWVAQQRISGRRGWGGSEDRGSHNMEIVVEMEEGRDGCGRRRGRQSAEREAATWSRALFPFSILPPTYLDSFDPSNFSII
jgi:hypothetical protein